MTKKNIIELGDGLSNDEFENKEGLKNLEFTNLSDLLRQSYRQIIGDQLSKHLNHSIGESLQSLNLKDKIKIFSGIAQKYDKGGNYTLALFQLYCKLDNKYMGKIDGIYGEQTQDAFNKILLESPNENLNINNIKKADNILKESMIGMTKNTDDTYSMIGLDNIGFELVESGQNSSHIITMQGYSFIDDIIDIPIIIKGKSDIEMKIKFKTGETKDIKIIFQESYEQKDITYELSTYVEHGLSIKEPWINELKINKSTKQLLDRAKQSYFNTMLSIDGNTRFGTNYIKLYRPGQDKINGRYTNNPLEINVGNNDREEKLQDILKKFIGGNQFAHLRNGDQFYKNFHEPNHHQNKESQQLPGWMPELNGGEKDDKGGNIGNGNTDQGYDNFIPDLNGSNGFMPRRYDI